MLIDEDVKDFKKTDLGKEWLKENIFEIPKFNATIPDPGPIGDYTEPIDIFRAFIDDSCLEALEILTNK